MHSKPILFGFGPAFGLPDPSPFTLKVYFFLCAHDIDFEMQQGDPRKTPHKKIPVLEHNGKIIPDSELIIDYLIDAFDLPLPKISDEQMGLGHMLSRGLDDKLYWSMVHARWMNDANAAIIRDALFAAVPSAIRKPLFAVIRRGVKKDLYSQGLGRMNDYEINAFVEADLDALSQLLANKSYIFGDLLTRYDCALAAYLGQLLVDELDCPQAQMIKKHDNLVSYWNRFKNTYIENTL